MQRKKIRLMMFAVRELRTFILVATKLGDMRNDVVFLSGCTPGLFITDPEFPDVRYTLDVDCSWKS